MKENRYYIDQEFVDKLARRIRDLRNEHNHTQEYLIDKVRLSINSYEMGTKIPTMMSILKLCKFYKITLDEFFAPMNYPSNE